MPMAFSPSERKKRVRELWCTPLITALAKELGRKYFYLGFPGPEADDLKEWKGLLERIIAFERPAEGTNDEYRLMTLLERQLQLLQLPFDTYFGLMEEILSCQGGTDLNGKKFRQDELVTLYQLDFCQAFTGLSEGYQQNYRYDAIRQLLSYQTQQSLSERTRPFVIFLTVRDEIHTRHLKRWLRELPNGEESSIIRKMADKASTRTHKTQAHPLLKAFIFTNLQFFFRGHNIYSMFLPPIHYMGGSVNSPMVIFTVLACYDDPDRLVPPPRPGTSYLDFHKMRSLRLTDGELEPTGREEHTPSSDPLIHVQRFVETAKDIGKIVKNAVPMRR